MQIRQRVKVKCVNLYVTHEMYQAVHGLRCKAMPQVDVY